MAFSLKDLASIIKPATPMYTARTPVAVAPPPKPAGFRQAPTSRQPLPSRTPAAAPAPRRMEYQEPASFNAAAQGRNLPPAGGIGMANPASGYAVDGRVGGIPGDVETSKVLTQIVPDVAATLSATAALTTADQNDVGSDRFITQISAHISASGDLPSGFDVEEMRKHVMNGTLVQIKVSGNRNKNYTSYYNFPRSFKET